MFGIEDEILAYQFDDVVYLYGQQVENLLEEQETDAKGKTKRKYKLKQALRVAAGEQQHKGLGQWMLENDLDDITL